MNKNHEILDRITGQCTPNRNNKLTGANYPYRSADPCTLRPTATGAEGTGEFLPQELPTGEYFWDFSEILVVS